MGRDGHHLTTIYRNSSTQQRKRHIRTGNRHCNRRYGLKKGSHVHTRCSKQVWMEKSDVFAYTDNIVTEIKRFRMESFDHKMSKSDPGGAILIHDEPKATTQENAKTYLNTEDVNSPIYELAEHVILPEFGEIIVTLTQNLVSRPHGLTLMNSGMQ